MIDLSTLPTDLQDLMCDWPAQRATPRTETTMTTTSTHAATHATTPAAGVDPVDWEALHQELARPFPDALIKYRVGAINRDKTKAQALPYVDPRAY